MQLQPVTRSGGSALEQLQLQAPSAIDLSAYWSRPGNKLSKFFPSVDASIECLKRALAGDDAEQIRMARALYSPADSSKMDFSKVQNRLGEHHFFGELLNPAEGAEFLKLAIHAGNPDAIPFEAGVKVGLRTAMDYLPIFYPDRFKFILGDEIMPKSVDYGPYCFAYFDSLRSDACPSKILSQFSAGTIENPAPSANFDDYPKFPGTERVAALLRCVKAGDPFATWMLGHYYNQKDLFWIKFDERAHRDLPYVTADSTQPRFWWSSSSMSDASIEHNIQLSRIVQDFYTRSLGAEFRGNPAYDPERAKLFLDVAEWLQGNSKSKQFSSLEELTDSKLLQVPGERARTEAERLYDLGWGRIHATGISEPNLGFDLLKHSANLGYAPASWLLGMISENYDHRYNGLPTDLAVAASWYKEAADHGHLHAKSRYDTLVQFNPSLRSVTTPSLVLSNPSQDYLTKQPFSVRGVEIPDVDLSDLVATNGKPLTVKLDQGIKALEAQVSASTKALSLVQARINDFKRKIESNGAEISKAEDRWHLGVASNVEIGRRIQEAERQLERQEKRIENESIAYFGMALIGAAGFAEVPALANVLTSGGPDEVGGIPFIIGNAFRPQTLAVGTRQLVSAYMEIEATEERINSLVNSRIPISKFTEERSALIAEIREFESSSFLKSLEKDELGRRRLLDGFCKLILLYRGQENAATFDLELKAAEACDLDAFIERLPEPTAHSMRKFLLGVASTPDLARIYAATPSGEGTSPEQKAFYQFANKNLWPLRDSYFWHAANVDLLQKAGLAQLEKSNLDVDSTKKLTAAELQALMVLFSGAYGVNAAVATEQRTLFSFGPDRHGRAAFFEDLITEGERSETVKAKRTENVSPSEIAIYQERVKRSYAARAERVPVLRENLYLRLCAYDYCYPQAVRVDGPRNVFADNPTGPAAYILAHRLTDSFVQQLGFSSHQEMNTILGEHLSSLVAQGFLDFFSELGNRHSYEFESARGAVLGSYQRHTYPEAFTRYLNEICESGSAAFGHFVRQVRRAVENELLTSGPYEARSLEQQLASAPERFISILTDGGTVTLTKSAVVKKVEEIQPFHFLAPGNPLLATAA